MDGLDAEAYDRVYTDRALVRRILRYFRPHGRLMLLVSVMTLLASLLDAVLPILISHGIDVYASDRSLASIAVIVAVVLLAGGLSWIFNFVRQANTARAVGAVVLKLRKDAFGAVLARDMSFYDEYASGKVVSRVTSDTEDFATVVTLSLNLVSQILQVAIVAGALFYISTSLALVAVSIAPVCFVIALAFRRIARVTTQRARRALANVNSLVQETMSGISVAKSFRQERAIYGEFKTVNQRSYEVNLRQGLTFSGIFPLLNTITGLGTVAIIYFGGAQVASHSVTAGSWYLFVQAIELFTIPLTGIASFWSQFQQGLGSAERVFALVDATPRVQQTADEAVPFVRGAITFERVNFAYTPNEPVLTDFSLRIPAGQTVALVGHTGAGKSTMGKLVARFYEFQAGRILIDERDIRSLNLTQYRHHLGVVPQLPFLFNGTIFENIRYVRPDATEAQVEEAARRVCGGDWLEALPDGLRTQVGELGRGLSLGQRQLVALSRLMLQRPASLILDEAPARGAPLTEARIQEGRAEALADRTALVIAHRLSTVKRADRILVLDHGRIVEEGAHDDLLARGGRYAQLYNTYFRHQSADYLPGSGFVPVRFVDKEIEQLAREEASSTPRAQP